MASLLSRHLNFITSGSATRVLTARKLEKPLERNSDCSE